MVSHFDRWEKDPFFSAAEEVQESTDRMESTYRTWLHSMKDSSSMWNPEELRRDLRTALGTTKWQLEEFERAAKASYTSSLQNDAKERHREFVIAIESQISKVESSLRESTVLSGKPPVPWVRLDEGECNELAMFLSGPSINADQPSAKICVVSELSVSPRNTDKNSTNDCPTNSPRSVEEKLPGHRRTASASADIGAWKITVADDVFPQGLSNGKPGLRPPKVPSVSALLSTMETASMLKWSKNGYRKLKNVDHHHEVDTTASKSQQLKKGINTCYERSKSCLDGCDDCCDKQLYGWSGAIQRLLQRSQYQMQYSRPLQVLFWIVLLCVVVLFALHAI